VFDDDFISLQVFSPLETCEEVFSRLSFCACRYDEGYLTGSKILGGSSFLGLRRIIPFGSMEETGTKFMLWTTATIQSRAKYVER